MNPTWRILTGDCIEVMAAMPEASVDVIVCDPPYGIGFMGKEWDGRAIAEAAARDRETRQSLGPASASRPGRESPRSSSAFGNAAIIAGPVRGGRDFQAWCEAWAREALRVLKPGGHLLAFGGTRTYHRLASGIEDAGFEVRDMVEWLYGSGFPKSLDVSKAIDKAAGAEREVIGPNPTYRDSEAAQATQAKWNGAVLSGVITAPATPDAERWQGWGTALKPAHEPVVVARKPLAGTVAANVLAHGTGALNVDGCRIGVEDQDYQRNHSGDRGHDGTRTAEQEGVTDLHPGGGNASELGRWPANVVLDQEAAAMLDQVTGELVSGRHSPDKKRTAPTGNGLTHGAMAPVVGFDYADSGGASRFFYVAKADTAERNAGLGDVVSLWAPADTPDRNDHPTVKPIDLMRWLVRLVTPPGGVVLDPFTGSGTTGCAAVLEGLDFIGIEREAAYVSIARARIAHWTAGTAEEAA